MTHVYMNLELFEKSHKECDAQSTKLVFEHGTELSILNRFCHFKHVLIVYDIGLS